MLVLYTNLILSLSMISANAVLAILNEKTLAFTTIVLPIEQLLTYLQCRKISKRMPIPKELLIVVFCELLKLIIERERILKILKIASLSLQIVYTINQYKFNKFLDNVSIMLKIRDETK